MPTIYDVLGTVEVSLAGGGEKVVGELVVVSTSQELKRPGIVYECQVRVFVSDEVLARRD